MLLLLELSLRVSEAVGTDIDDLSEQGRHRVLRLKGKGQSAKAAARQGRLAARYPRRRQDADPRTTRRYDQNRNSLNRHPTHRLPSTLER